jgi:hypothetical protein
VYYFPVLLILACLVASDLAIYLGASREGRSCHLRQVAFIVSAYHG